MVVEEEEVQVKKGGGAGVEGGVEAGEEGGGLDTYVTTTHNKS